MTPSCSAVLPQAVNDQSKMEQRSESGHCSGDDYSRKLPPTSDDRFFNVSQFLQEEDNNDDLDDYDFDDENSATIYTRPQSTHVKQQQKLKKLIKNLEGESVTDKPWQLTGEITSQHRPANSLLEEVFTFDHMTRITPTITEETTRNLEEIIKQRILDEAWDDIERKMKPVEKPLEYTHAQPLDQTKSSLSLAETYGQEFLKQSQAEDKEDTRHLEIKELMFRLFHKLDTLSNLHFTPKPAKPDIKVVMVNVPSLAIEEVTPSFQSDTKLSTPQVKNRSHYVGQTEKTKTDKLRERRKKKKRTKIFIKSKADAQKFVNKFTSSC
ncbi:U3 small nucleolar ribonucleoprotein protein MPP10-like [Dysidea avara]|uniref:U3 small nucleolar ribonucleoprotein protein MPP10-like n=1 Tax=Dysidea avara TaxID=196820 RepID=UPI00332FF249